ncbi:TatD family deoxyribonuclease [Ornithobacterium rhinotracheale]|uniref:TatD family hydrolase n=1 Tax=Ornithobacterium rhinotracheale TaxID=28251 RepID=UPI00129CE0A0|nr:TatD family hydrolase [Ornithobacterium rhinotracheale]MRJ10831.1 TatD family deoxyribonuclease [Ornithobacterium rhinotracheale]
MYIDSHTHLYSEAFENDVDQVVEQAISQGVERFFLPAVDSNTHEAMLSLEERYPKQMYSMMGLHPVDVKPESYKQELTTVEEYLAKRAFAAVGEIGIDLYWEQSTLGIQQEAFNHQIHLAKKYNLPIVIHCREAFDEVFEVLEQNKDEKLFGIFHCFTGTLDQAEKAISYGLKLGIGGVVTFKNGKIDQFLNQIPLEHIVLETDSPYLAPTPHRGKRNESKYIPLVAQKLVDVYGVSLKEIEETTTKNSLEIFNLYK